jgi:SIR2-like domain
MINRVPIDPVTSLAFSLQSQPGVYAVLIGSGVSRAANIPTGWGIVNDLLRQLAVSLDDPIPDDPPLWYEARFGNLVGFSELLGELAPHRSDRRALLARFIEPDSAKPDERVPTSAHRALARLAKAGLIRVFITTNFDRLLEQALTDEGVTHHVISNSAQAAGAAPFHHSGVVVFKLHGDYLDPDSMLVTESELAEYDEPVAMLLARTLEDYGLIVCGWSADWDPALSAAISATRSRRYPFHFAAHGATSPTIESIIAARDGAAIPIDSADIFFEQVSRRVDAISRYGEPHPLDTVAMLATLKSALPRPERRIELEETVSMEVERLHDRLIDEAIFPKSSPEVTENPAGLRWLAEQANRYWIFSEPIARMLSLGVAWGEPEHDDLWVRALSRVVNSHPSEMGTSIRALTGLQRLPGLVCLYAAGLAAVNRRKYRSFNSLCVSVLFRDLNGAVPLIGALHPGRIFNPDTIARVAVQEVKLGRELTADELAAIHNGQNRLYTPASDLLHDRLRPTLAELIPDDAEYTNCFDRLEVLLAVIARDAEEQLRSSQGTWIDGPWFGSFTWRDRTTISSSPESLFREYTDAADQWEPLKQGMFGGSTNRVEAAFTNVIAQATSFRRN